jgi:hypothetical protein
MLNVYHNHLPVKDPKFIPTTGKTILSPKILRVLVMMFNPIVLSILLFSGSKNSEDSKICPETSKEIGQEVNWFKLGPSILCNS